RSQLEIFLLLCVLIYVLDCVANARNLFRGFIGNLNIELLFESHNEFNGIERIRTQIVDKTGVRRYLCLIHSQLIDDNSLHSLFDGTFSHFSSSSQDVLDNTFKRRWKLNHRSRAATVASSDDGSSTFSNRGRRSICRINPDRTLPGPTSTNAS